MQQIQLDRKTKPKRFRIHVAIRQTMRHLTQ
ncbi:hypothetical protein GGD56_004528 [Rhizobium mongolense]|uniref:Transposase n=1 Tax=Rhizobium mongolense TaxID=57676 RepID=A0ABR6ISK3_9HYPH|nr:hypothetical protein [Rhizobium mongolense]